MEIYRFNRNRLGKEASKKAVVVIISPSINDSIAEEIKKRFPKALRIAEVTRGREARAGYFNVLRIHKSELDDFDYDLKGCKAMIVEGVKESFYLELLKYREVLAERSGLSVERIRFCCNFLSTQGSTNFSCYSANILRDYAAEMGIIGILPTTKKELLDTTSLCMCVKN